MVNLQQCPIEGVTRNTGLIQSVVTGNVIPKEFYQIITTKSGTPDHVAITIFSEIIYWYRPSQEGRAKFKGDSWQSSYSHFEQKFGYYHEKVRRAFVRLEALDLVRREFRAVEHHGQKYPNRLFIHLTNEAYKLISKSAGTPQTKEIPEATNNILPKFVEVSPQIVGDYIKETKNIYNNRSMDLESDDPKSESNSIYFSDCDSYKEGRVIDKETTTPSETDEKISSEIKAKGLIPKARTLADFYPLSEEVCTILQSKSGRDFNLNAMNEILLSMSKRLVDREFRSKRFFLNYMAKALSSEIRQAEKINNDSFRIKSNKTQSERSLEEKEKFLDRLEKSRDVSDLTKLKKKFAGRFDTDKAYGIIQAIKAVSRGANDKIKIDFDKWIELRERDIEIIREEVISVFDISGDLTKKDIEIELPIEARKACLPSRHKNAAIKKTKIPNNVWGRVRKGLIEEFGKGIDISWFSKLEENIDETTKKINLKAPNGFMRDWVNDNYKSRILSIAKSHGFDLEVIR